MYLDFCAFTNRYGGVLSQTATGQIEACKYMMFRTSIYIPKIKDAIKA